MKFLKNALIAATGAIIIGTTLSGAQQEEWIGASPATPPATNYAGCPVAIVHAGAVLKLASSTTDDDSHDELVGCFYSMTGKDSKE